MSYNTNGGLACNNEPLLASESSSILNYGNQIENSQMTLEELLLNKNEKTVINIKEKLKDNNVFEQEDDDDDEMEEISLHEELDALSPLIIDNHTLIEHQEHMIVEDDYSNFNMKHSDTKNSISSIDSDLSLSFDRHNSIDSNHSNDNKQNNTKSKNPFHESDSSNMSSDENCENYLSYKHYNSENGKDSGCDDTIIINNQSDLLSSQINEADIEIPDDELSEKIIEQVEFYFSNDNILKDAFLLKHVRRNKEGFVSLKLVSSFKRVRQLTKDWRVVGYAIKRKSKKIELNDLETKIRRLEPLPVYDETTPSRTVVATDLPYEKITIEKVSDIFGKCGEIALVRILRPGNAIPSDVRQFINKYPELQQKECALVEFLESNAARLAQNMNSNIKVYEMIAPKKKTGKKATVTKMIENFKYTESNVERSRGGDFNQHNINHYNNNRNNIIKRNNSGFFNQQITPHICQNPINNSPRKLSFNNIENSFEHFHRRSSNCSDTSSRKYSNCSEGYSSCSEMMSRRPSNCSDMSTSRRQSACSDLSRRSSNCSEHYCHCGGNSPRRVSQCNDIFRHMSPCHVDHRKLDNRKMSNTSDLNRRLSMESSISSSNNNQIIERKSSHECPRKISPSGFDLIRKLSSGEQYYISNRKLSNDSGCFDQRKLSSDSGYDRKLSMSSDISSGPTTLRSRSGSLFNNPESVVRTPIGPDGSKGFASRTRKLGQTIPPV